MLVFVCQEPTVFILLSMMRWLIWKPSGSFHSTIFDSSSVGFWFTNFFEIFATDQNAGTFYCTRAGFEREDTDKNVLRVNWWEAWPVYPSTIRRVLNPCMDIDKKSHPKTARKAGPQCIVASHAEDSPSKVYFTAFVLPKVLPERGKPMPSSK